MAKERKTEKRRTHDRIELRSERVRDILGSEPKGLLRCGMAVLLIMAALLLATVMLVKYPYGNGETILRHLYKALLASWFRV